MAERLNMAISLTDYLPYRLIHRHCRGIGEIQAPHLGSNRNPQGLLGMCGQNLPRQARGSRSRRSERPRAETSARILPLCSLGEEPGPALSEQSSASRSINSCQSSTISHSRCGQ